MKLVLVFILMLYSNYSSAWGPKGQQITVLIAEKFLTPVARQKINMITGSKPLASFAVWADGARNTPEWSATGTWHYIDVSDSGNYIHEKGGTPTDVLSALIYCSNNLKMNVPNNQKMTWLMFVIHFVGDIHQPMHVGNPQDRGGNQTRVQYGKSMNLHFLWDSAFIDKTNLSVTDYANRLISQNRPQTELRIPFDPNKVISENLSLRKYLYSFRNGMIDSQYEKQAFLVTDERLWQGGLRLASLLNEIFR